MMMMARLQRVWMAEPWRGNYPVTLALKTTLLSPFHIISQVRSLLRPSQIFSDSLNMSGTAIYLFCIQPPSNASAGGTPTTMNLSFTLDNQPAGNFLPTETNTEFLLNQNVLSLVGLSDQLHQLVVTLGDDSVFLFSGLIYTNGSAGNSTSSAPHTT